MVSPTGSKRPSSDDEKYDKVKRSLAEDDAEKKHLMLVEAIVDLLVSNDINHVKMMESIDYLREELHDLKSDIAKQFSKMWIEFDGVGAAVSITSGKVDALARHVERIEEAMPGIDARLGQIEMKLANQTDRFGDIDKKLASHDGRFGDIDKKVDAKLDEVLRLLRGRE